MFFKRWGKSQEAKIRDKFKSKIDGLKPAKTKGGQNIGLVEMIYFAVAIGVMFLLLGLLKGDSWGALIVLLGTVAALSHQVRGAIIPQMYDVIAERFGWPLFEAAQKAELEAREGKDVGSDKSETPTAPLSASAQPVLAAPAVPEQPKETSKEEDPRVPKVLYHFSKLEPAEQTSQAIAVFTFLHGIIQNPLFDLVDVVAEDARPAAAQKALLMLAEQKGVLCNG